MLKLLKLDRKSTEESIENFISDSVEKSKRDGVVLGISGGLDSACVAALAARALGAEKVLGVQMNEDTIPCPDFSSYDPKNYSDMFDSNAVIKKLGIKSKHRLIGPLIQQYKSTLDIGDDERLELGNIKARTRMTILYYYANKENKLVAGTGDKSEILTGYFTKYGDGGVDFLPIGNLYKTHVRELSKEIGVPNRIITKPSSPGLWKGQTAEDELGISYEALDPILFSLVDKNLKISNVDYDRKTVEYVNRLVQRSAHKRDTLPKAEVIYCER